MVGRSMRKLMVGAGLLALVVGSVAAEEWPDWRGPRRNGTSSETGLVSTWSRDGENLIWKAPLIGRSTPVIVDGRVCVMSRTDDAKNLRQERVACYDAENGKLLWEDRYNVYHTTVPFNRVGWASPVADPETGNVYTLGVAGLFRAYDAQGQAGLVALADRGVRQTVGVRRAHADAGRRRRPRDRGRGQHRLGRAEPRHATACSPSTSARASWCGSPRPVEIPRTSTTSPFRSSPRSAVSAC